MALTGPPFPSREPPIDAATGLFQLRWLTWLRGLREQVDLNPSRITTVSLANQNASIGTTAIPTSTLVAGLYQAQYFARVTTAAVTSSSLTVTFTATDDAQSYSLSGTAITGNTVDSTGTGTFLLSVDGASPVSYSTTYASNGAGQMVYKLEIVLTLVAAS